MTRHSRTNKEIFTTIFETNYWKSRESVSGPGAEIKQTHRIRKTIPEILKKYNIRTILDIPCGDFNWMRTIDLSILDKYIGADIVSALIKINNKKHSGGNKKFIELNIINSCLPKVNLIFSRDCFIHLKNKEICRSLNNIKKSGSNFLLTTTYIYEVENIDTQKGKWRPINLNLKPFNLPPYIKYINTDFRNKGKNHPGNGMALWKISDFHNIC